ncbi:MAG TPA: ATP-binding cassette domain-containing protein [Candidatus Saccharimonadales bacterium]|nr:ATP-binding cassette domain-containing protein [Candidatus Saccharimonadales bacterium]
MNIAATLRGATIVLDDRAILRAIDLDIGPGLTIVRGSNGAGKTTLLRAIAGLVPLARGSRAVTTSLLSIGHRPQLLRGLSARENLRFFAAFRGVSPGGVDAALGSWGIAGPVARRPVETLSAGQRRRAALARIDSEGASLILLDEPFGELDDEATALLRGALGRLARRSAAVVVATHGHHELDGDAAQIVRL